jgi:hypothetical protein
MTTHPSYLPKLPLKPKRATDLIKEILDSNPHVAMMRANLIGPVLDLNMERGGAPPTTSPEWTIKKALARGVKEGKFRRHPNDDEYYLSARSPGDATPINDLTPVSDACPKTDVSETAAPVQKPALVIEIEIGEGPNAIYLYFDPDKRTLAQHNHQDVWPCKIGCTSRINVETRILE